MIFFANDRGDILVIAGHGFTPPQLSYQGGHPCSDVLNLRRDVGRHVQPEIPQPFFEHL